MDLEFGLDRSNKSYSLVLSIGNITMKLLILDGRELSPSDTPCEATKDEDYYLSLVTFEVKGKSQEQF
jgi:hypothetical protein